MSPWEYPPRYPGSLYPCCPAHKPPDPPCPPPACRPDGPEDSYTVKVLGCDRCGNLILSVSRPRYCWANGEWVSCKKWR